MISCAPKISTYTESDPDQSSHVKAQRLRCAHLPATVFSLVFIVLVRDSGDVPAYMQENARGTSSCQFLFQVCRPTSTALNQVVLPGPKQGERVLDV
jgi:hypothetical protein